MDNKTIFDRIRDALLNVATELDGADAVIDEAIWYVAVNMGQAYACDSCGDQTTEPEPDGKHSACKEGQWHQTNEIA